MTRSRLITGRLGLNIQSNSDAQSLASLGDAVYAASAEMEALRRAWKLMEG
jgi:hypothetical protein